MSRIYTVTFELVAVTLAQDAFQITGAAGKIIRVKRWVVSATDTTIPTSQMLAFRARFLPATITNGNGGTVTPAKTDPGDAAASFTALANSTTKATTSGAAIIFYEGGCHVNNGLDEPFDWNGQGQAHTPIGPSEAAVLELLSAPSGTLHLSSTAWVEEIGG